MDRHRVLVLGALNEEHHQERHDGRSGVDDELPGIGVLEDGPGDSPYEDSAECNRKGPRSTSPPGNDLRERLKGDADSPAMFLAHVCGDATRPSDRPTPCDVTPS